MSIMAASIYVLPVRAGQYGGVRLRIMGFAITLYRSRMGTGL